VQEKETRPVGSTKAIRVDVRVIAATNRKLEDEVRHERLRTDLSFRLNVVTLKLPPREPSGDIAELVDSFLGTDRQDLRSAPEARLPMTCCAC
jgi:transcriptional regulator with PAS, ATPase and Fis domain